MAGIDDGRTAGQDQTERVDDGSGQARAALVYRLAEMVAAANIGMGGLPGAILSSSAQAVSPDGSIIVGYAWADVGYEAWRWTAVTGMVSIGELPLNGTCVNRTPVNWEKYSPATWLMPP